MDWGKTGSKHHMIVRSHGIPLATTLTGGNRNDVTLLIHAVPPARSKRGQPLDRPRNVYTDLGFEYESYRDQVLRLESTLVFAQRGTEHA